MSTTATLDSPRVSLEPGAEATVPLHIRNDGEIVEEYRLRWWGRAAPGRTWCPELCPSTRARTPPPPWSSGRRGPPTVPAGEFPYAVQVLPTEHPEDAVAPEGIFQLLPFHETTAELLPRQSRGCFGAGHRVAVDNYGNVPITVTFTGSDPGDLLQFSWREPTLTVAPGTVEFARARVNARRKIWRGMPSTHSFAVAVRPADGPPVVLDGIHVQEPVLPRWIVKAVLVLVLFILILVALWFVLLNPPGETRATGVHDPVVPASQTSAAPARL